MVKREPTSPPRPASKGPGKRSRANSLSDQLATSRSPMPTDDSEVLRDMWDEPLAVLKDTWAVTRCVTDHGNRLTRWTAGHFVAVAMWSGGLEAGIQAAKAIRIFGIWSPHADYRLGKPPPLSRSADRSDILDRLWPTVESKQDRFLEAAQRSNPGTPFPDFETALRNLLHQCIGPDLTKFPTVVRPKLQYDNGAPRVWKSLVTVEQFWDTLAPVLRKYFNAEVDLASISQHIQPYAFQPQAKSAYRRGGINIGRVQRDKLSDRDGSYGKNKETNTTMIDDYRDDDEDFEEWPKSKIKAESALSRDGISHSQKRLDRPRQEGPGMQNLFAVSTRARRYGPILPRSLTETHKFSSPYGSANGGAVQPVNSSSPTLKEPQPVYCQVVNQLYERTCDASVDQIEHFRKRPHSHLALPQAWKKICDYRMSNNMRSLGARDRLPHPRVLISATSESNDVSKPHVGILKSDLNEVPRENAKDDLSKFERFCSSVILID